MNSLVPVFIKKGSEMAGGATGAALGFLVGGPIGAAAGSATGTVITIVGGVVSDFVERSLSHRETVRAAASASISIEKIQSRIASGEEPRDDDFFRTRISGRPKAEELFEAMLLKSKSQYEEHKVSFYSTLFANACFDTSLDADMVSWFMLILDRLTFGHIETLNEFVLLGKSSKWEWQHLNKISEFSPVVAAHLEELKSMRLLSPAHWGDTPIEATGVATKFIQAIAFTNPFDAASHHIIRANAKNGI